MLVNEVMGSEFLRLLGIASPEWAVITAQHNSMNITPRTRVALRQATTATAMGPHFGSKVPVDPLRQHIFDAIPPRLEIRLTNRHDFLKVFVFDVWSNHQDRRQAIFFRTRSKNFTMNMIDNGRAFGFDGMHWRMRAAGIRCSDALITARHFTSESIAHLEATIADVRAIDDADFQRILRAIPRDWIAEDGGDLLRIFEEMTRRSRRLGDLVATAVAQVKANG